MRRISIIVLVALGAVLSMVSCNTLHKPKHADSRYLKSWIFRTCIDNDYRQSLVEDFGASDYNFSTPPRTLKEACLAYLFNLSSGWNSNYYWNKSAKECKTHILEAADNLIRVDDYDNRYDKFANQIHNIFCQDPDQTRSTLSNMVDRFFGALEIAAELEVHIINWKLNEDAFAETYTGYLVEYEIGEGFYVLLDLIENNDDDRYQWKIMYSGNSLIELQQSYE